jgi:predicted Ser/Thr protein kinase
MGDVYEGLRTQGDFEQRVAIKLLQRDAASQLERFEAERQILARLEHSGIARLYDGGVTSDGRPFMVMEYVEGRSITDFCMLTHATFEQRLGLFIQVCDAVAYAHRNLIVHRDLKPSNILVTAAGVVKLLDFGIAKLLDPQLARMTQVAVAPMTPICAAPEQLTGDPITTATDVYALGLLLFELLTGAHAWVGSETPMLLALRTVLQRSAPSASRTAEGRTDPPVPARMIRGDLDAIVAKALRTEPAYRYATVDSVKLDVERVLDGEPVAAREGARLYLLGHLLRRYRWSAAAAVAIFLSLAVGLGLAAWQGHRAAQERDIARRDAAREEAVRYQLTRLFRTAIADNGAQPATAKNMIDSSAQRVLREYQDQPQLAGQIVLTLADLYGALEDVTGADALLEGFIAEANAKADPAALADARQKIGEY